MVSIRWGWSAMFAMCMEGVHSGEGGERRGAYRSDAGGSLTRPYPRIARGDGEGKGTYSLIMPRWMAWLTASVRLSTLSFWKRMLAWNLTVRSVMKRSLAISLLRYPFAINSRTC